MPRVLHPVPLSAVLVLLAAGCAPAAAPPMAQVGKSHPTVEPRRASSEPVRAERIAVAFGDVKRLATMLERALVDGPPDRGDVRAVLVDERSGELVVFGTEAGIARARAFLSPGVIGDAGADDVEVLRLEHADADNVSRVVGPLVTGRIRVVPDKSMNALVLSGDADARARVKKIVASLDVPEAKSSRAP